MKDWRGVMDKKLVYAAFDEQLWNSDIEANHHWLEQDSAAEFR